LELFRNGIELSHYS